MNGSTTVLLACLAVIALLAALIYVQGLRQIDASNALSEVRHCLEHVLAGNRAIQATLDKHRSVLNDAHRRIYAVTKGLKNPAS